MKSKEPKKLKTAERSLTRAELANELDLHPDSITRHIQRGAPHDKRGGVLYFNTAEYLGWMQAEGLTGEPGYQGADDTDELRAARILKERALAARYQQMVEREAGRVVDTEEVRRWIMTQFGRARDRFLALGSQIAPQLEGRTAPEIEQAIRTRAEEILNDLSRGVDGSISESQAEGGMR